MKTINELLKDGKISDRELKNNLIHAVPNYGELVVDSIRNKYTLFKSIQSILNIITFTGSAISTIFTTIFLSLLWFKSFPDWYFFLTTGITSATTFISAMLNFFLIKEKVRSYYVQKNNLFQEIIKYKTEMIPAYQGPEKDYNHFIKVQRLLGSTYAKSEVSYGSKGK